MSRAARGRRAGALVAALSLATSALVGVGPASAAVHSSLMDCSKALPGAVAAGSPVATAASLGGARVTLAARGGSAVEGILSDVRLELRSSGVNLVRRLPRNVSYLLTSGSQVCLVAGSPAPSVVVLAYSGGAHCCYTLLGLVATRAGFARPLARTDLADFAALRVDRGSVVVRSGEGAFAYTFQPFAGSAEPILLESFTGSRFVDVTRAHPELVTRDAATWWTLFRRYPADLSYLAGWVADEALLGRAASAWRTVASLRSRGGLKGTVGYPSGGGFVRDLHRLLGALGYPTS